MSCVSPHKLFLSGSSHGIEYFVNFFTWQQVCDVYNPHRK